MGKRPLRPCRAPGCHILVPGGFCPAHQPKRVERSARAASWRWMYGTETWAALRTEQLLKEPFCRACANDMGLTITSRCRLVVPGAGEPDEPENPFLQLIQGGASRRA